MTQARFKIKKGDLVQVTAGKDKGKRGIVQKVLLTEARVLVEGVNEVRRHTRPSEKYPNGVYVKNLSIHISNVMAVDSSTDKPGKVFIKINEDGTKSRLFKKSNTAV